jgi:DNA-directed DNA polymerase III PolC
MYLNCHSYFSFLYGTLSIKELIHEAQQQGIKKLALTDINNTSGIIDFHWHAQRAGITPVAGIDFRQGSVQRFVGLAKNKEGFRMLNELLTQYLAGGKAEIPLEIPHCDNAFLIYPLQNIPTRPLRENEFIGIRSSEIPRILFSPLRQHPEKLILFAAVTFSRGTCKNSGANLHQRSVNMHRLLRAIDNNTLLTKLPAEELAGKQEIFFSENELQEQCALFPALLQNAKKILNECSFDFTRSVNRNKKFFTGSAQYDSELLEQEGRKGLAYRYSHPDKKITERLNKELEDVRRLGFTAYFLISWDIVRYAREQGFFYVGRGSGANSLLAYCLCITDVDPVELDLYFERFINPYRSSPPDFDLDFSWKDRDDIIEYIFKKHGKEHTALLGSYNTFQHKALVRELGKVLGLPKSEIDELAENGLHAGNNNQLTRCILTYSRYLQDFPHHLSIHAGGILISEEPITSYTALSMPPKGFPVTQFSMLEAEDIGLYKFDILSQRGLGHIRDTTELIKINRGENIDIHNIKAFKQDEKIAALIREGKCMGCFYVESPAMRMLLKKLRCEDYLTLVAASSIIRPGVSQSGMMREYIQRFHDPSRMQQTPEVLLEILRETYGVMVFQEDVIRVAHHFAGLSLAEADVLRRGMSGKFRSREEFAKIRDNFFRNCAERGYAPELSAEVWRQIESFAGYSFSKGHSASYAAESYQSLYLKAHYPLEFIVGVINNFGGFYKTEYYLHEARMSGATLHAPCVNHSLALTRIDGKNIFLGMGLVAQLEQKTIEVVITERCRNGTFTDLQDFCVRTGVSPTQLRILIRSGALRFTQRTKKQLLWDMLSIPGMEFTPTRTASDSGFTPNLFRTENVAFTLPDLDSGPHDDAMDEIELFGFPLCSPFSLLADDSGIRTLASELPTQLGKTIDILGYYVTTKPTKTIKGEYMLFGTFLDREGNFFDTTHFPRVAQEFPLRGKAVYHITGKVVQDFGFYSVDVIRIQKLRYAFQKN